MRPLLKNKKVITIALSALMLVLTISIGVLALYFRGDNVQVGGSSKPSKPSSSQTNSVEDLPLNEDGTELNLEQDNFKGATTINKPSEMRAVYMTPGVDYLVGSTDETTVKTEIDKALTKAKDLTMNTIIFETKLNNKLVYLKSTMPNIMNEFDALQYAISKAKEMSFYTYAIYDVNDISSNDTLSSPTYLEPEHIDEITANLKMFANNYYVDGIILDSYYNKTGEQSFNHYLKNGGGMGYEEYMLLVSKTLFSTCTDIIRSISPGIQVGMMTESVWENQKTNKNGSVTVAEFTTLGSGNSNNIEYIEEFIPDFVAVKTSSNTESKTMSFSEIVEWWDKQCKNVGMPMYVVHASSKACTEETGWTEYDQIIKQVMVCEGLNSFEGSIFNSLSRLSEDPKESTTRLIKYYNNEINTDFILKELAITVPKLLKYETFEPTVTFMGASDPYTDVTINGKKIATDSNGYFTLVFDLVPGDNKFIIDHKGKTRTYDIYRRVVIIKEYTPTGNMTVEGDMTITVSALAYADADITAKLKGQTIQLEMTDSVSDDTDNNSNYRLFEGTFTVPAASTVAQNMGNITIKGDWQGMTENKTAASVTVSKKMVLGDGRAIEIIADQAETFPINALSDYSSPYYYPLPKGTKDYAVGSEMVYNDGKKSYSYYRLASNLRVYTKDIKAISDNLGVDNNKISSVNVKSDSRYTYITLDMSEKASYTAKYDEGAFSVQFHYTTAVPKGMSLSNNPIFTSLSFNGTTMNIDLRKNGSFMGYKAYYDGNDLVFRFNNPPAVSSNSLKGVKIVVDPGHGGSDPGATGFHPSYPESVINYQIAYKLTEELKSRGANVYMINTSGASKVELADRVAMARKQDPHILISVHCNAAAGSSGTKGTEAYYFNLFSRNLSGYVSKAVADALVTTNRGGKFSYFYMVRDMQFASTLVETGFLTNEKEYKKLISASYQQSVAEAVSDGVYNYLRYLGGTTVSGGSTTSGGSSVSDVPSTGSAEVQEVTLNKEETSVTVGSTTQLKATVSPSNAANKKIIWESDDTDVATVSSTGLVTGKSVGETIIYATSDDNSEYAECIITVKKAGTSSVTKVSGIKLPDSSVTMYLGDSKIFKPTITPTSAVNQNVEWYTMDSSIATVDQSGRVIAKKVGSTTIIVDTEDGGFAAKCDVTVKASGNASVTGLSINPTTIKLFDGQSDTIFATVSPANAKDKTVTYKSSNTSILTVDSSGNILAIKPGTTTVTATTKDGGKTAKCTIIVLDSSSDIILPDGIYMDQEEMRLSVGDSDRIICEVMPDDAEDLDYEVSVEVISGTNPVKTTKIASGIAITALSKGKVIVKATHKYYKDIYNECVVIVS